MKKILLFSSICKPVEILKVSLPSYLALNKQGFELDILFYDDNKEVESSDYLKELSQQQKNVKLLDNFELSKNEYQDHNWSPSQINRIITIKNYAIDYCVANNYDSLFLVDSDLVLHPNTLVHLLSLKLDFVFEVFWTLFFRQAIHKPNAWDKHSWAYKGPETLIKLKTAGTYEVGGGGACTLLSNRIMKDGVNFNRLKSLPYQGEDRHICTHAQAKDFRIMVDTFYPAYHIFSQDQIQEAKEWYENGAKREFFDNWLDERWKSLVYNTFNVKKLTFLEKLKKFQYTIRINFIRIFTHD